MVKRLTASAAALLMLCGCSGTSEKLTAADTGMVIVDVRTPEEQRQTGYIAGAVSIIHTEIHTYIGGIVPDKNTPVAVYCRSGRRSAMAAEVLRSIGYKNVTDLGGFDDARRKLSLPVVKVE